MVFRDVPAEICDNCGEPYLSSEITRELLERVDIAAREGVEVAVVRHAA